MARQIESLTGDLVLPILEKHGFELIEVEYAKTGQDRVLTVYIDKPGGISLDDCEAVSRELEPLLDEADPIDSEYILSVSSPGLDRPLKTEKDYQRNLGRKIYIKTYRAVDKKKEFVAHLTAYDAESVTIEINKKKIRLHRGDIAVIKQHVDF